jgi:hypothetical protein
MMRHAVTRGARAFFSRGYAAEAAPAASASTDGYVSQVRHCGAKERERREQANQN